MNITEQERAVFSTSFGRTSLEASGIVENIGRGIIYLGDAAANFQDVHGSEASLPWSQQLKEGIISTLSAVNEIDIEIKDLLDTAAEVNAEKEVVTDIQRMLMNGDGKNDSGTSIKDNLVKEYEDRMKERRAALTKSKTNPYRHNENPAYKAFRIKIWEMSHPNEPMPSLPASNSYHRAKGGQPAANQYDDELQITGVVQCKTCPITQMTLEDPVTSKRCNHSFSRAAIQQMIAHSTTGNGTCECPVIGCVHYVSLADLVQNKALARWVARQEEKEDDADDGYH